METPDAKANPEVAATEDGKPTDGNDPTPPTFKLDGRNLDHSDAHNTAVFYELQGKDLPAGLKDFVDGSGPNGGKTEPEVVASGDVTPIPADSTQAEPAAETVKPESEALKPDGSETAIPAEGLAKSLNALKRWKWTDATLDNMSPEDIISQGAEAMRQQSEADRTYSQKQLLEQTLAEYGVKKPDAAAEAPATYEENVADPSPMDAIANDAVHADLVDPLTAALKQQEDRLTAQFAEQQQTHSQELQRYKDESDLESTRLALQKEWPQLADPAKYEAVKKQVYQLSTLEGYHDEDQEPKIGLMLEHACLTLYGADQKQQQQQMLRDYKGQTQGQPEDAVDDVSPSAGGVMTKDEKSLLAQDLLSTPKANGQLPTGEEVRQMLAKIPEV